MKLYFPMSNSTDFFLLFQHSYGLKSILFGVHDGYESFQNNFKGVVHGEGVSKANNGVVEDDDGMDEEDEDD